MPGKENVSAELAIAIRPMGTGVGDKTEAEEVNLTSAVPTSSGEAPTFKKWFGSGTEYVERVGDEILDRWEDGTPKVIRREGQEMRMPRPGDSAEHSFEHGDAAEIERRKRVREQEAEKRVLGMIAKLKAEMPKENAA